MKKVLYSILMSLFAFIIIAFGYEKVYDRNLIGKEYVCFVKRIVDGDTLDAFCKLNKNNYDDVRIRIASIDTFESKYNKRAMKQSYIYRIPLKEVIKKGLCAKKELKKVLPVKSKFTCKLVDIGKYGRLICIIRNENNVDISLYMICNGYANPYMVRNEHLEEVYKCLRK